MGGATAAFIGHLQTLTAAQVAVLLCQNRANWLAFGLLALD